MPKVNAKRQITLPKADCIELSIRPGDEVEIFRYENQLNVIKREPGIAAGVLKGTKVNKRVTEAQSLADNFD